MLSVNVEICMAHGRIQLFDPKACLAACACFQLHAKSISLASRGCALHMLKNRKSSYALETKTEGV